MSTTRRDVETLPLDLDSLRLGDVDANNAFTRLFWEKLSQSPELATRVTEVLERERDPLNAFSTGGLLRMVGGALLLQGRFDVLPAFFKVGQKMEGYKKEVARRRKMLETLPHSMAPGASLNAVPA